MPEAEAAPFQVSGFTRTHREARASSETVNKDDVEELLHSQARWKDRQNAGPELTETSLGDAESRSSST